MAATDDLTLYGEKRAETVVDEIAFGRMSMRFVGGSLEDLAIDGHVVLRAVQFVHRDRYWRRIEPILEVFDRKPGGDRYRAVWTAHYSGDECGLSVAHAVDVTEGKVAVSAEVTARSSTVTNRTGFVLLHPVQTTAARSVDVTHPDGTATQESFPEMLSPHAVLTGIRALEFPADRGIGYSIELSGDVFETEDQRNWTDWSFKTFSRPLSEPVPYTIEPEERFRQTVCISARPRLPGGSRGADSGHASGLTRSATHVGSVPRSDAEVPVVHTTIGPNGNGQRIPRLGFGMHFDRVSADKAIVNALRRLRPSVIQLRLNPADPVSGIPEFVDLVRSTGAAAALEWTPGYSESERGPNRAVEAMMGAGLAPSALALYPNANADLAAIRASFPGCLVGGGTPYFFAFAHRTEQLAGLDFIQWTMPPGVHDIADRAIMETLSCIPDVLDCARQLWPNTPFWIGPSSLRPRFRPTTLNRDVSPIDPGERPDDVDPRQQALFGASWAVGYLSRLAYGGVETALMFEPFGARGVVERVRTSDASDFRRFPIYDVLLELVNAQGCELRPLAIDRKDLVLGLAWSGAEAGALFANLSPRQVHLHVSGAGDLSVRSITRRRLAKTGFSEIALGAYEVVAVGKD